MSGQRHAPDLLTTLAAHEAWTDARIPTVASARVDKHARMAAAPFAFLRATYPRWAQRVAVLAADPPGPRVVAVGDLHVENFGTWRDAEGRLVWGVNDLDEVDVLPAAHDLLRLATSALLAEQNETTLTGTDVVTTLLDGYAEALAAGGGPLVLDRPEPPTLGPLLPADHARRWWHALLALPPAPDVPAAARDLLLASLPAGAVAVDLRARTAGMGSRDHLRVVAIARAAGGPVVREVKSLAPPATRWLADPDGGSGTDLRARLAVDPGRAPDPALRMLDGWVVRRLAPWSDRIELTDLHHHADAVRLVHAMGGQTAAVHLTGADPADAAALAGLAGLTDTRGRTWLADAARRMLDDTVADWRAWHTWCTEHEPHVRQARRTGGSAR